MQEWKLWEAASFHFASPENVHVWLIPLRTTDVFLKKLKNILSEDELQRAARFRFEKHRKNFISARGHLRLLLSAYTGLNPHSIKFTYNEFGKPFLNTAHSGRPLFFNISHSHELALIAFNPQWELGVDIEWMPPDFNGLHLVKRFFSANEIEQIEQLPEAQKKEAFFNGWTRKEAYIKARGKGLNIRLSGFSVSLKPGTAVKIIETSHDPKAVAEWNLQSIPVNKEYKGAIVVHSLNFRTLFWQGKNLQKLFPF